MRVLPTNIRNLVKKVAWELDFNRRAVYSSRIMQKGKVFHFKISINSQTLDFRAVLHPSESLPFLITRVLAYVLNYQANIRFSAGVCIDEAPVSVISETGEFELWIDINPNLKRISRAVKTATRVCIYTFKKPEVLKSNWKKRIKKQTNSVTAFWIDPVFLESLATVLDRDNHWVVIFKASNRLEVKVAEQAFELKLEPIFLD